MKRRNWNRVLAMLLCMVMILSNLGFSALAEFTEPIPCAHSNYTVTTEAGEAATCTQAGWHTVVTACTDCGEVLSREQVADAALGHDYQVSSRTEATCTEPGSVTWTCTRCGDSYTEAIEAGHSYVSVVTDPTCTQDGYITWTCSVCGDSYTEAGAEALDHDYQESKRVDPLCL